ncbi:MAG: hypothetical protein P4N59_07930 [Negativicutes bacterium]|nr:hypothetical protein [Negativicutes bacterium]
MKNHAKFGLVSCAFLLVLFLTAGTVLAAGTWIITSDGAQIWDPDPQPGETASWSGDRDANGKANGDGILEAYVNGQLQITYAGPMLAGKVTGQGKITWPSGSSYAGDLANWSFEGHGIYQVADGPSYEGDFVDGKFSGHGHLTYADGSYYDGAFLNGQLHGQGTLYKADGSVLKQGTWSNGHFNG